LRCGLRTLSDGGGVDPSARSNYFKNGREQSILNLDRLTLDAVARGNTVQTTKLQLTVDINTDRLVGELAYLGIHGVTKSEVASSIIRMWLWENQSKLLEAGIDMRHTPQKRGK
jgi:hypothetical protein